MPVRLSLILPTYNEAKNLPELLRRVHQHARPLEVVVVDDDSPDRTWEVAESLKVSYPNIRVLRRVGKKGLSSAVADGCDLAEGNVFIVMDSDLQHDPSLVSQLEQKIEHGADIAVASRYREGGGVGEWVRGRRWLSKMGTYLARKLPNVETTDPMSGFFAVRSDVWRKARPAMVPEGFKILFELLAAAPRGSHLDEVPLQFQLRLHGESKLSMLVQLQFLKQALRIGLRRVGITGGRLFALVAVVLAAAFLWRMHGIRRLYVSSSMRSAVAVQLRDVARAKGWLLSDIDLEKVGPDGSIDLVHRRHVRGPDPAECWTIPSTGEPVPCAN